MDRSTEDDYLKADISVYKSEKLIHQNVKKNAHTQISQAPKRQERSDYEKREKKTTTTTKLSFLFQQNCAIYCCDGVQEPQFITLRVT